MNIRIFFYGIAYFSIVTVELVAILTASKYKPESLYQTPYFQENNYTSAQTIFSGGSATHAYNEQGKKVPLLEQFGTQALHASFVDSAREYNDYLIGTGNLEGKFHVKELIISGYKNMTQGFFIETATVIQDMYIDEIGLTYSSEITPTEEQSAYLKKLHNILPISIQQSGLYTIAFYGGYTHSFIDFNHIDFIDFMIKTGFTSPQVMTPVDQKIIQFPFYPHASFGYPIIATAAIGLLDWITLGLNGSIVPYQTGQTMIGMPTAASNNSLLHVKSGMATIHPSTLMTAAAYFQADHFHQGLSLIIGYSYNSQGKFRIQPYDQQIFSSAQVEKSACAQAWKSGSWYIQFDIDFASFSQPNRPIFSMFCTIPTYGISTIKTNIFGANFCLQISQLF